jgi:hypothetical protein
MNFVSELRHAARRLVRRPLLALLAVATLAIGIGVNTAVFSLLEGIVLRELPLPEPDRVVDLHERDPDGTLSNVGYATYRDWAERSRSFASLAVSGSRRPILEGDGGEPETLDGLGVTSTWLPTLGIEPLLGRNIAPTDDRPGGARGARRNHGR